MFTFMVITSLAYLVDFSNVYANMTAGPALVISISYSNASFYQCGFYSYQDTVYIGKIGNTYMYNSIVAGQVDFLYGFGTLWIQSSVLSLRGCGGGITAWKGTATTFNNSYGVYIKDSKVLKSSEIKENITGTCYLGRPWNALHRSIFANTYMDDTITGAGYKNWTVSDPRYNASTLNGEYKSYGPGFNLAERLSGNFTTELTLKTYAPYNSPWKVFRFPFSDRQGNVKWIDLSGGDADRMEFENADAVTQVTVCAPVNIAVIKYWGKRDVPLNLPTNSSLSVTLHLGNLRSTTTAACSALFTARSGGADLLWLNGKQEDVKKAKRFAAAVEEARRLRRDMEAKDSNLTKMADLPIRIASENNFPTAAGLASSASGYAALVFALKELYDLPVSLTDLSRAARLGSGSACRSLFGGFVAWRAGDKDDGTDSVAEQVAEESHWPEMEALILVASDAKKDVGSTEGMQATVATSELFSARVEKSVPLRMRLMEKAIKDRDFDLFAETTMRDSNQFHATCMDTFPPVFYMNDTSRAAVQLVHRYNDLFLATTATTDANGPSKRGYRCAYTFDAGPNAVIYTLSSNIPQLAAVIHSLVPTPEGVTTEEFWSSSELGKSAVGGALPDVNDVVNKMGLSPLPVGAVRRIIHTRVGPGPSVEAKGFVEGVSLLSKDGEALTR
ncbi:diphosphomevalonate decarboxylase [Gonapodya sp. JEL0774]|nr:diphosphomevalonate decarboxylase [Gonapodya sp. JEL0774]